MTTPLYALVFVTVLLPILFGGLLFVDMKSATCRWFAICVAITAMWVALAWCAIFLSHDGPSSPVMPWLYAKVAFVTLCGLGAVGVACFRRT